MKVSILLQIKQNLKRIDNKGSILVFGVTRDQIIKAAIVHSLSD